VSGAGSSTPHPAPADLPRGPDPALRLAVVAHADGDRDTARELAARLGLPILPVGTDPRDCNQVEALLLVRNGLLELRQTGRGAPGPVTVDFDTPAMRHRRRGGHNELLGRAVGVGRKAGLRVLDATAGLGRDGFVLADLGCAVVLCEREPVVVEMLRAGLAAAALSGDARVAAAAARIELMAGDARDLPRGVVSRADAIYLDPMFPGRRRGAAVKKEMALFRRLLGGHPGGESAIALLQWALSQPVSRVVVKRPARETALGGMEPSYRISGSSVRYDVYTVGPWA